MIQFTMTSCFDRMFLLLHGIGDYMALEEDNWSQQAVGISLNPGDMLLQLAPNVFCFWSDSLKTFERKGGVKTVSKKTVLYHTRFASRYWYEPGLSIFPTRNFVFQLSTNDKCNFFPRWDGRLVHGSEPAPGLEGRIAKQPVTV